MTKTSKKKEITKTKYDSVNHTRCPKEDHLPEWASRDNKVTKGDHVELSASETRMKILSCIQQDMEVKLIQTLCQLKSLISVKLCAH